MVTSSVFPVGTPVWYNFSDTINSSESITITRAHEGVVRAVSRENKSGELIYEVVRKHLSTKGSSERTIYVESVNEYNIAFGCGCPVYLQTKKSNFALCEMRGEIIQPCFATGENGKMTVTYMVKMTMDDGTIQIVDGVLQSSVRYRFGLDTLRATLRRQCLSNKMIGIRTGCHGLPLKKRKLQDCNSTSKSTETVLIHVSPSKKESIASKRKKQPTAEMTQRGNFSEQLVSSAHNATINKAIPCKNIGCHRQIHENCDGYCLAHHCFFARPDWSLYYQKDKMDSETSSNCQNQTVIDLTEEGDEACAAYARANPDYIGYI
jgi:hypothetical protein